MSAIKKISPANPAPKLRGWKVKRADASPVLVKLLSNSSQTNHPDSSKQVESISQVRFKPYVHTTSGTSEISIKVKGEKDKPKLLVSYDPLSITDPKITPRAEIKLPGVPQEIIDSAKLIAASINKEMKPSASPRIKIAAFEELFLNHSKQILDSSSDYKQEILTLTAYFCLDKHEGFLSKLPDGLLNMDNENFLLRARTLGRYFLVNHKKIDTAEKVESFGNWSQELPQAGLTSLYNLFSPADLLKVSFPGYLDGPNPPIKEWLISSSVKWESNPALLPRACKNIFFTQDVLNPDLTINTEKVLAVDWGPIINDPKNGLRGAMAEGTYLKGALSIIRLAAPGLIGIEITKGQIPSWKFERLITWTGEEGFETLDDLTKYLVEKKLKLFDEHGKVSAQKIKEIKNWNEQYRNENKSCLERSGIKADEALRRVYPHLFGWESNQIQPGELKVGGKWTGKQGINLFRRRFAKSIHTVFEKLKEKGIKGFEKHKVRFNPLSEPPLFISKHDFTKLIDFYIENEINWWEHMIIFNLSGAFAELVDRNLIAIFELLFGKINRKTSCFGDTEISVKDTIDRNPTKTALVVDLLSEFEDNYNFENIKIKNVFSREYTDSYTGIQGSCLGPILIYDPASEIKEKTKAFYDAFCAAGLLSDKNDKESDADTALEKMLIAKNNNSSGYSELTLSNERLRTIIKTLRNDVVENVNINDELKKELKTFLQRLLDLNPPNTPRDLLLTASRTNRKYGMENNPLSLLNSILEHMFEVIAIHEIRTCRATGSYTKYLEDILEKCHEEPEVIS